MTVLLTIRGRYFKGILNNILGYLNFIVMNQMSGYSKMLSNLGQCLQEIWFISYQEMMNVLGTGLKLL